MLPCLCNMVIHFFLSFAFIEWRDTNFCSNVCAAGQYLSKFDTICSVSRRPHFFDQWQFLIFLMMRRGGTRWRRWQAVCGLMRQSVVPPMILDGRVPQDLLSSEDVVFDDMNSGGLIFTALFCSIGSQQFRLKMK